MDNPVDLNETSLTAEKISLTLLTKLIKDYSYILDQKTTVDMSVEQFIEHITRYYQEIISCMPGNVYWFDKNATAIGCNNNVLKMLNMNNISQFRGLSFEKIGEIGGWTQEALNSFKNDSIEVIRTGIPKLNIEELPIPHPEKGETWFLTSRVPLFNQAREVIGLVGISIDITERKKMEQALVEAKIKAEAANNLKIEFIQNMEHDIRTPFSGIYGIAKLLASEELDPRKKGFLLDIQNCAKELLDYSTGILDFSMIESGSLPIVSKRFSVKKLINSLIAMESPPAKVKQLDFSAACDANVPDIVLGDRYRLQRVLINLLSNAIKFTHKGSVQLHARLAKKIGSRNVVLCFIVQDTGMGIPANKQNTIFEKFNRLTPANQGLYRGHGLGLRLVKQFVDEMDGDIDVKSIIGQGSSFICTFPFKLPLVDEPLIAVAEETEATSVSVTRMKADFKVLIVDDYFIARKIGVAIFENLHCAADTAENGINALELFTANRYDLILVDIGLPDIDGFMLAKKLRQIEKNKSKVPIVALTAHTDDAYTQQCHEAGMDGCITKPLTIEGARALLTKYSSIHVQ